MTVLLLTGCGVADAPEPAEPTPPPGVSASAGQPTAAPGGPTAGAAAPPTADEVRSAGRAVDVAGRVVHVLGAVGLDGPDDGALTVGLPGPTTAAPSASPPAASGTPPAPVRIAGPPGSAGEVLMDGTAVLREASGAVVVAVVADGARLGEGADGLLEVTPAADGARVVVGGAGVVSATWADRGDEGGLSLVVVPRAWVRTAGAAGVEAVWSALGSLPDLGSDATAPGMRDQLECHALGAPDKESWNLEPWRPDVGLLATLTARCNPT